MLIIPYVKATWGNKPGEVISRRPAQLSYVATAILALKHIYCPCANAIGNIEVCPMSAIRMTPGKR